MAIIFIRTLVIFIVLVIVMRLMGKRQIGEMQPFEFIVTLIIADLACVPMADVSIPLIYGIVAVLTLFLLHQLLSIMERSNSLKKIISGKPSIVINKDGIDLRELKSNNMDVSDLIESLRAKGYFSLDDVDYAIFESNGKLSTLSKSDSYLTKTLPILLIDDGKIDEKNLCRIDKTKKDLENFLENSNCKQKNVEVMTIDGDGRVYLKKKGTRYSIYAFPNFGGKKW